jgi:hypothetical protein
MPTREIIFDALSPHNDTPARECLVGEQRRRTTEQRVARGTKQPEWIANLPIAEQRILRTQAPHMGRVAPCREARADAARRRLDRGITDDLNLMKAMDQPARDPQLGRHRSTSFPQRKAKTAHIQFPGEGGLALCCKPRAIYMMLRIGAIGTGRGRGRCIPPFGRPLE